MASRRLAGVDIGNSTTEVCIATLTDHKELLFESSSMVATTGTKGTVHNAKGVVEGLTLALAKIGKNLTDLDEILLNEAAPVIGDTAMETITQTIITESTMIGHNPDTPSGEGIGLGTTIWLRDMAHQTLSGDYIVMVPKELSYEETAHLINQYQDYITGAILQADEAVLVQNRITKRIPIVDEVQYIERIPLGMQCAIEVAMNGVTLQTLSNPYGIANLFGLSPAETKQIIPVAKSLIGIRSAVVVRSPKGEVTEKVIPAGKLTLHLADGTESLLAIDRGAEALMQAVANPVEIEDITGEPATNIGNMLANMRSSLVELSTSSTSKGVQIKDILAVDVLVPVSVQGALAGEMSMEKAVALAAMVKADKLPMEQLAQVLRNVLNVSVEVAGVEAVMASLGAMTTQGSTFPMVILDLGGGSTDAAILEADGSVRAVHLGGAGNFITMLIDTELGLENLSIAEDIKRYPLAKVESLFHIRLESGEVKFFTEPLDPRVFGKVVVCKEKNKLVPVETKHSIAKIATVRREAKEKVFVANAMRALKQVAHEQSIYNIPNVVLVGGSALDFEIPGMILEKLSHYGIVVGKGEIRGVEGPRNAVATGLILSKVGAL